MIVLVATEEHLPGIATLEAECFRGPDRWSAAAWEEELAAQDRLVLVAQDTPGRVIAAATWQVVLETMDLHRIMVTESRRREGIARALFLGGLEWGKSLGATQVLLEVDHENAPALAAYQSWGLRPLARRKDYYGSGRDALVLATVIDDDWSLPDDVQRFFPEDKR